MSLVIGVITENFAIMCGDGKSSYSDNVILSDFKKVFKFNNDILVGITGDIASVKKFIGFLFNFDGRRFTKKENLKLPYLTLKMELDKRFDEIIKIGQCQNFFVSISGLIGNQFCMDCYFYNPLRNSKNRKEHVVIDSVNNCKFVCMESTDNKHFGDFLSIAQNINTSNIPLVQIAFKKTLECGVKYDDTINCNAMFEFIEKDKIL